MGKVGKGIKRRKNTLFTSQNNVNRGKRGTYRRVMKRFDDGRIVLQGHTKNALKPAQQRPTKRFPSPQFDKIVKKGKGGTFSIPAADGSQGSAIVLRPLKEQAPQSHTGRPEHSEDNILVEKAKLMDAINHAITEHSNQSCENLNLDLVHHASWGHYSKVKVACTNCNFVTKAPHKLYAEAEKKGPGPLEARGNLRLQYLLQEMPIGIEKVRLILAALGIRPGSRSGMQANANKVAAATVKLNTEDMDKWAEEVKMVLKARGAENPNHVNVAVDGRYDGASLRSWATPGRGATAATGVMVEQVTDSQKVIGMVHYNKTCTLGTRLRGKGQDAKCGAGEDSHLGCTADLPYYEDISEKQMGKDLASTLLAKHGLYISHVTTDGDGLSSQGIRDVYNESGVQIDVHRYKDLTHLGACQRKHIMKMTFAAASFGLNPRGLTWNYQERLKCRQALANDIQLRCAVTLRSTFLHYESDIKRIQGNIARIVDYMMRCYSGDHSRCKSAVLSKVTGCCVQANKSWFDFSPYLRGQRLSAFTFSDMEEAKVREVIEIKLCAANIPSVAQLLSTQKVESVNRAINVSDPKNFHYCRNAKGRNHSAVHRINNGPEDSIHKKLEHGRCSLPHSSGAAKAIHDYQQKLDYSKLYKQQDHVIARSRLLRTEKIVAYQHNAWRKNNEGDYLKHQLDNAKQNCPEGVASSSSGPLTETQSAVKKAKKNLKKFKNEQRKKKIAAAAKRRRTWQKNAPLHAAKRKEKEQARRKHYTRGSSPAQHVKSEHAYSDWQEAQ
jgi:hypothetical protein